MTLPEDTKNAVDVSVFCLEAGDHVGAAMALGALNEILDGYEKERIKNEHG